mmetsp:Transcript_74205/g.162390  ORF Transcript_74205/g.162390 Transcript_74205/m.162390 type:complete len:511 (+) Transcript_74205:55-1587(+)
MAPHTALAAAATLLGAASAAPAADIVDSLPGWDAPLLSKTYSGYIPVGAEDGSTMYEHYMFFESEGNPAKDPLIMWTNGGPGASSLMGSFTELGPYFVTTESLHTEAYKSTGVPTIFENPFRWTKLGNLLIRNLPPPIGFSYCDPVGPSGDGYSCGSWNDTKVAKHSANFMRNWMNTFPEYGSHDLYLSGESYAGVYVPMLARELLEGKDAVTKQLKGIMVGDGCLGMGPNNSMCIPQGGPYFQVEFFHGHGQFSDKTYNEIKSKCSFEELRDGVQNDICKSALDKMDKEKGFAFEYNLYDECYDFSLGKSWNEVRTYWGPSIRQPKSAPSSKRETGPTEWHMDGTPCGGLSVLPIWAKVPEVRTALHVPQDSHFFIADNGVGFTYNFTEPSMLPWYRSVIEEKKLRVLVYNGDADPSLNIFYAENWTSHVGVPEAESWRPWTRDGKKKMGGYVTKYESNFDFVTIRGAGHMVPEYKPEAAFVMAKSFIQNTDYPRLNPKAEEANVEIVV